MPDSHIPLPGGRSAVKSPDIINKMLESTLSDSTLAPTNLSSASDKKIPSAAPAQSEANFDTKRNKELHHKFPEVPVSEFLIENYVCALGRGAKLIQGRIFITRKRVCFFSSILGMTYRITMYFDDIQSIKRKVSVGFIPNAIEIVSDSKVFYFCSFLSRDAAYERMVTIWKQSNIESFFSTSPLIAESKSTMTSRPNSPETPDSEEISEISQLIDPHSSLSSPSSAHLSSCTHGLPEKSTVLCDESFPTSAKVLWGLLHGDKSSHIVTIDDASVKPCFLDWFLSTRSVKNLEKTAWLLAGRGGGEFNSRKQEEKEVLEFDDALVGDSRSLFFDMNLGIQTASSKQVFTVTSSSSSSICIESKTTNTGVPFSSSYSTMIYMCIQEVEGGLCRLFISYRVVFEKDCYTIIKNPVNQAIRSRLPEFYNALIENLNLHFRISSREPSIHTSTPSALTASSELTSNSKKIASGTTSLLSPSAGAPGLEPLTLRKSELDVTRADKQAAFSSLINWFYLFFLSLLFLVMVHLYSKLMSMTSELILLQQELSSLRNK